jgi:fructosamine-3-kinase
MIPGRAILQRIADLYSLRDGHSLQIEELIPVVGGSINKTFQLRTNAGHFFLKQNNARSFPGMFEAEEKGMKLLKANSDFIIPSILFTDVFKDDALIVMEFVPHGEKGNGFFERFGRCLAKMHQQTQEKFGLDHNNYIGSLPQSNQTHSTWTEFFIQERLGPQLKKAIDEGRMGKEFISAFEKLYAELDNLFPKEKPALLHGDLWNGNYLADGNGNPCIFDPAVYYGHREMDIAMTKLFGGFSPAMYESYQEQYPLEKGWQQRVDICNLYPLMVHVNLFGESYVHDVRSILEDFLL